MSHVADDADDLPRLRIGFTGLEQQSLAQRVCAGKELLRQRLIDDYHLASLSGFLFSELAASQLGNLHSREITGADTANIGVVLLLGILRRSAFDGEEGVVELAAQRQF